jgi:hypothetical protein
VAYYSAPLYAEFSFVVNRPSRTDRLCTVEVVHECNKVEHWGEMASDSDLVVGVAGIVRSHLKRHWPEALPHVNQIAETLVKRQCRGESEMALISYVEAELGELNVYSRGMPEAIVDDVLRLIST